MISKRQALVESVLLWDHLAAHPEQEKWEALETLGLPTTYLHDCPACEYATGGSLFKNCNLCPIWEGPVCYHIEDVVGIASYARWTRATVERRRRPSATTFATVAKEAKQIANLARRKLLECGGNGDE